MLLSLVTVAKSQNTEPFVAEGKRWNVLNDEFAGPMQPGDSFLINDGTEYLVLDSICEVLTGTWTYNKYCFHYSFDESYTEIWIEGIGSELGVLNVCYNAMVGGTTSLLCYFYNDELVWYNEEYEACYYNNLGVGENAENQVTVYPNPANGSVTISGGDISKIEVINITGKKVLSTVCNSEEAVIDLSGQPAGVYFINITDKNGRQSVKKIVRE